MTGNKSFGTTLKELRAFFRGEISELDEAVVKHKKPAGRKGGKAKKVKS